MAAVFGGFLTILLGCLLLAFPAAVARLGDPADSVAARVFATRGTESLASEWSRFGGGERTRP